MATPLTSGEYVSSQQPVVSRRELHSQQQAVHGDSPMPPSLQPHASEPAALCFYSLQPYVSPLYNLPGELQRLRNIFEEMDSDDSGDISISELRKAAGHLPTSSNYGSTYRLAVTTPSAPPPLCSSGGTSSAGAGGAEQ